MRNKATSGETKPETEQTIHKTVTVAKIEMLRKCRSMCDNK
jgi:hypothetical protein